MMNSLGAINFNANGTQVKPTPILSDPLPLQPEPISPYMSVEDAVALYGPDREIYQAPSSIYDPGYLDIRGMLTPEARIIGQTSTGGVFVPSSRTIQPAVTGAAEPDDMGPLDVTTTEGESLVLPITPRSMRGSGGDGTPVAPGAGVDIFGAGETQAKNNAGLIIAAILAAVVLGG